MTIFVTQKHQIDNILNYIKQLSPWQELSQVTKNGKFLGQAMPKALNQV